MKTFCLIFAFLFLTSFVQASDPSTEELIQNLQSPDAAKRQKAAEVLGDRGEKLGVDALVAATTDKDPKVQMAVVKALGKINDPRQVSSLSTALRNTSGDAQKEAMHLLTAIYIPTSDRNALEELWTSMVKLHDSINWYLYFFTSR